MSYKIYFTPGPTQLYYTVNDHMRSALRENIGSISHRGKDFQRIFQETRENLTNLLNLPDGYEIYFTSSANEVWERIIQNLIKQKSHHFVNGAFAKKFYDFARLYQKSSTLTKEDDGHPFKDLNFPEDVDLISITLNETSIGYQFPLKDINHMRDEHPDKLIAVDGVSAFPCIPFDFSKIDTAYFSVQKAFGLPSGLGVWIVNQKCIERASEIESKGNITGSYHRLSELRRMGLKYQTPETPNTLSIYLLGKVAKDMLDRGIQNIQNETIYKSAILYQTLESSPKFTPFVQKTADRSKTVIVGKYSNSQRIIEQFLKRGWVIGSGYGKYKDEHIRIANFPMHSKEQIEQLCDFIATL